MKENQTRHNVAGTIAIVMISLLLIFLGIMMLFTNGLPVAYLCYIICCLMIIWGIWLMGRYVMRKEYKNIANYGFTVGTAAVALGVAGLIGTDMIIKVMPLYLGVFMMVEAAVMLQHTVQLMGLNSGKWVISLVFSTGTLIAAICMMLNVLEFRNKYPQLLYILYIVVGGLTLWSLVMAYRRSVKYKKDETSKILESYEEMEFDQPNRKKADLVFHSAKEQKTTEQEEQVLEQEQIPPQREETEDITKGALQDDASEVLEEAE